MRYLLLLTIALTALLLACGGGDDNAADDLAKELGDICTQGDNVDDAVIRVDSPDPGDDISSPLTVKGEIDAFQQQFWVSVVKADGQHVIDYPARSRDLEEGKLSPFEVSVPFSSGEESAACLWVYRRNVENPDDAVRIPVLLQSTDSPAAADE